MKTTKNLSVLLASFLVLAVFTVLCPRANAESSVVRHDGLYIVTLEGSPYEIGFQQGELLKDEINDILKIYLKDLVYNTWVKEYAILGKGGKDAWGNPRKAVGMFAKGLEEYIPEEYLQEMKGIADGAGVSYIDVLNMTAHVDYFAILCSTLVASGDATPDGKLVEARNLDWAGGGVQQLDKYSTVFVVKPDNGHAFVSVLYPGLVGALTAVNDSQLTAELNFSMAKDNDTKGVPGIIMVRQILQYATNPDEAEKILADSPRLAGYNITIADGKTNDARLIEITHATLDTLGLDKGVLISTNHFITEKLSGQNIEASQFSSSPSGDRYDRLTALAAENHGSIDQDKAKTMIHDDIVKVPGTVQTVIFKPADNEIQVWARNREPGDFVTLNVDDLISGKFVANGKTE